MKGNRRLIVLVAVVIVIAVVAYNVARTRLRNDPNIIRVSGNIEVTDAEVSFKMPGRVQERLVSEGETVKAGQVVARLDADALLREVDLRKAEVRAAEAFLAELQAGARPEEIAQVEATVQRAKSFLDELLAGSRPEEIAAGEAEVQRAKADADRLKSEFDRYSGLYKSQTVSAREFELAQAGDEMAAARLRQAEEHLKLVREGPRKEDIEQARAALKEASERFALVKAGPRKETIDQARARLDQAKQGRALAETQLGYATVVSPLSGVVLSKHIEPGEYVMPGTPVVTVGDLENVWVRAYINETDLGRVKVGQRVRVTTDTYPDKVYEGHISFISSQAEFTPKNVQTAKERVKLVYRIKVDIENLNMELKSGMPADAELLVSEAHK